LEVSLQVLRELIWPILRNEIFIIEPEHKVSNANDVRTPPRVDVLPQATKAQRGVTR
jgi:hypothetical protein